MGVAILGIICSSPLKTKYSEKFANFTTPFSSKKQRSQSRTRDRAPSWRQGSPQRLRSTSMNNSKVWERKEPSPTHEAWSRDTNWRSHMMSPESIKTTSPPPQLHQPSGIQQRKPEKNFLDVEFGDDDFDGDMEWVGGWRDFHV